MSQELNIDFHSADKFVIHFDNRSSALLDFQIAFEDKEQKAIKWYFEVYATDYTTDVDDNEAQCVVDSLPVWGTRLFDAVFGNHVAQRLYEDFQKQGGLLTISATDPPILALPWELFFFKINGAGTKRRYPPYIDFNGAGNREPKLPYTGSPIYTLYTRTHNGIT